MLFPSGAKLGSHALTVLTVASLKCTNKKKSFSGWRRPGGGTKRPAKITNNEELKFIGNAISDQHPRTHMGYTKELIIMVIEGRNP